jgi:sugar lactone lactonase YvrE
MSRVTIDCFTGASFAELTRAVEHPAKFRADDYDFRLTNLSQSVINTDNQMMKLPLPLIALALFTLPMLAQPDITNQATSQTVWPGGNVTFAVRVSGNGLFTYQWQFNSNNLPNDTITTIAGNGVSGFSGDGGPAANASLKGPDGVAVDAAGNLLIADTFNECIRKVSTNGIITTVAGTNNLGFSGDGGSATNACLWYPTKVAIDTLGNLFIADSANYRIRKVDTNGLISTVAGNGSYGYSGDGGTATNAKLYEPYGVTVDTFGNLFIADSYNARIREVSTNGIITTVAGTNFPGFSGDGGPAVNAKLNQPDGVVVDGSGTLFIADTGNHRIRKLGTNGLVSTVAGNGSYGYSSDGIAATNANLYFPMDVAVDVSGNLFIADMNNCRVRKVDTNGIITTVAGNGSYGYSGDGGPATNASLKATYDVAVDASGNLFIADCQNMRIRKVTNTQGPSLMLNNVSATNAGNYQVVVTGPGGSVTSSVAVLSVALPPGNFTAQASGTSMQIQFVGTPNYHYILQMATNLMPPVDWRSVLTNPADVNGNWSFNITNLSAIPAGFYRAVGQ